MRELDENQLESVAGGVDLCGGHSFWDHVGKYDGVVGQKYYITEDGGDRWAYGTMVKTYEQEQICFGLTKRTHVINTERSNSLRCGQENEFFGCDWSLYLHSDLDSRL